MVQAWDKELQKLLGEQQALKQIAAAAGGGYGFGSVFFTFLAFCVLIFAVSIIAIIC